MANSKKLDIWFNNLDSESLLRMFPDIWANTKKKGGGLNDFIDDCDEWWDNLNLKEKTEFYNDFC